MNISWLNVLWTILHCSYMPLEWPTPVVWPSWSLASAQNQLTTLSLASTSSRLEPLQLSLIRSSTVSERRDALVQCFQTPPPPPPPLKPIKQSCAPIPPQTTNHCTKHNEKKSIYSFITNSYYAKKKYT